MDSLDSLGDRLPPPPNAQQGPTEVFGTAQAPMTDSRKSYRHQNREWEVPEGTKVASKPGVTTGGMPQKISAASHKDGDSLIPDSDASYRVARVDGAAGAAGAAGESDGESGVEHDVVRQLRTQLEEANAKVKAAQPNMVFLSKYAFSDEGEKVKIYIDVDEDLLERKTVVQGTADGEVPTTMDKMSAGARGVFGPKSVELYVTPVTKPGEQATILFIRLNGLYEAIVPDKSTFKVGSSRVVVTVRKRFPQYGQAWPQLLRR